MAQLGRPETVVYSAKNLQTGLTDIKAYVRKPDGVIVGPIALTEMSNINFKGFYTFNFETLETDDFGIYTGVIVSPNEDNYRTPFKINYEQISIAELSAVSEAIVETLKNMSQVESDVDVEEVETDIEVSVEEPTNELEIQVEEGV